MRALVMCVCLVCVNYKGRRGSVAVADVPDSPLSTIGRLGLIPLAEPLAAQFTLTLLLLQYLKRNGGEFRSAGEDAVLIELDFVHVRKIGWIGGKVNRLGTVPRLSHIMLGDGDELRVFNATGEGGALPPMVGLPFGPFVHDVLNQVATAGRHYLRSGVGSTEGSGEDFDRLCFVHGSNMAQNRRDYNRCCASPSTGFRRSS